MSGQGKLEKDHFGNPIHRKVKWEIDKEEEVLYGRGCVMVFFYRGKEETTSKSTN